MNRNSVCGCACALAATLLATAQPALTQARPDSVIPLEAVEVTVNGSVERLTPLQRLTLPATASINARTVRQTVNIVDTEDAVKYLPSIFLRKRNNGDTQAVMGTRVWGVSSSARSLIFADGVPLSALIANNNSIGGPRWGLVSPVEIERVDVMYGPFSAAYSGNSMGAAMEITTRLPESFEASVSQTHAAQTFDQYGTSKTYGTDQTAANLGFASGKVSVWTSLNHQRSSSQPLGYVTSATFPSGTTGGFAEQNKLGAPANVLGASGLLHTRMTNVAVKAAYDLTPTMRAAYRFGIWKNDAESEVEPYLDRAGAVTYGGVAGFASATNELTQQHSAHALSLRTDTKGDWDFDAVATRYQMDDDRQRSPTTAPSSGTTFGPAGRVAVLDGTRWSTFDGRATWRPGGIDASHALSFGAHEDRYALRNPTYTTADWTVEDPEYSGVATEGDGKTRTRALWAQDAWRIRPNLKLTAGARLESWRAFDGYNVNGATQIAQPTADLTRISPKAVLIWNRGTSWALTGSVGKAYRFPTAAELYQLVSTGTTFTAPTPNLKPDNVLATELRVERRFAKGRATVALFQDDVKDAIISQALPLVPGSSTLYSYISNVDHVRARGAEVSVSTSELLPHLDVGGSVTYLNARTLALTGEASATAAKGSSIGKHLPNIPDWRASVTTTYRPTLDLALSVSGRYSGMVFTTLDNADVRPNTYGGFEQWFVADARASYRFSERFDASFGVDNVLNRKYFWFHPFPQRTFVGELKVGF